MEENLYTRRVHNQSDECYQAPSLYNCINDVQNHINYVSQLHPELLNLNLQPNQKYSQTPLQNYDSNVLSHINNTNQENSDFQNLKQVRNEKHFEKQHLYNQFNNSALNQTALFSQDNFLKPKLNKINEYEASLLYNCNSGVPSQSVVGKNKIDFQSSKQKPNEKLEIQLSYNHVNSASNQFGNMSKKNSNFQNLLVGNKTNILFPSNSSVSVIQNFENSNTRNSNNAGKFFRNNCSKNNALNSSYYANFLVNNACTNNGFTMPFPYQSGQTIPPGFGNIPYVPSNTLQQNKISIPKINMSDSCNSFESNMNSIIQSGPDNLTYNAVKYSRPKWLQSDLQNVPLQTQNAFSRNGVSAEIKIGNVVHQNMQAHSKHFKPYNQNCNFNGKSDSFTNSSYHEKLDSAILMPPENTVSYYNQKLGTNPSETKDKNVGSFRDKRSESRNRKNRSHSKERSRRKKSRSLSKEKRSRSRSRRRTRSRSRSRSQSIISKSRHRRSSSRSRSRSNIYSTSRKRSRSASRERYFSRSRGNTYASKRKRTRSRSRQRRRSRSFSPHSQHRKERTTEANESHRKNHREAMSEREILIEKWRMNNCSSQDEMQRRLQEISQMDPDEIMQEETKIWIRSAPADCYYERDENDPRKMRSTPKLDKLCERFKYELVDRGKRIRETQTLPCPAPIKPKQKLCKHKSQACSSSEDSESENSDASDDVNDMMEELQRKQKHPYRLHSELWYNDPGEMNDGPLCRCSAKARRSGIRHGFYAGENQTVLCDSKSNNMGSLYHYRITISPPINFLTRTPTIINYDDHEFIFEGFSLISHYPIQKLPTCKVIRFNIEYIILYVEEKLPENFTIQELDLFYNFLFKEILELVDFDLTNSSSSGRCPQFHFMPRFVRELPEKGRELLSMSEVLKYFLECNKKLIDESTLNNVHKMSSKEWQNFADAVKGMVVTNPGMKPCSLRVDQLDRDTDEFLKKTNERKETSSSDRSSFKKDDEKFKNDNDTETKVNWSNVVDESPEESKEEKDLSRNQIKPDNSNDKFYPEIVHFGIRPPQLSYAGNPEYQKAWRKYVKFRHLLANMPKPTAEDKQKLAAKENRLHSMRAHNKMKRDVTVTVSSEGFYLTGLMCDVVQHAMLIPVLVCHLRFHRSLAVLEDKIGYKFKNRFLLQLALTHPSYRENFGTNSDHARNSLTNCGIRQPKYGDRRIHYMNTRKRGINTLISIMSRFGKKNETQSNIYHNERLEFLGDAVVEFITSIHLFHIFRDLEEGGLATYRAALVQNQHLSVLAKKLNLDEFMLYAHGSDLCHDLELKHAMANCFEALMGALFLDGGIESANKVFGTTLFGDDEDCLDVWFNYPPHPLQEQEPLGDRKWIPQFTLLQNLTKFENATGIEFKHIRLLARAFTDRSIGYTNLTLGSNQRLEFLGDSVLQLIASEYLYKYFPEHHEGHLSLLRSSLVNNKTQSVVCDDLGMTKYAVYANPKVELKVKDRADLLEAFLGALYIDSGLEICRVFCDVCFFPRLQVFIMNQDWNDPKSKLQQCCLTLRTMDNVEPDIPIYKVVECKGPTNTREYTVAVYFRNKRLAKATGHSIQQAEMNAAQKAMEISGPLFPQLDHQKRVIAKSLKTQKWPNQSSWSSQQSHSEFSEKSSSRRTSFNDDSDKKY